MRLLTWRVQLSMQRSEALSAYLTKAWTDTLMKARGYRYVREAVDVLAALAPTLERGRRS